MQPIREFMASQFPIQSQSPFTIGDVSTLDAHGVLEFRCTLFWNTRSVAQVDSGSGPFEPLNWRWFDVEAKDDFASFLRLIRFPTADLFVGSMIACFSNIQWFARECQTDTLFRYPSDPSHVFQRVKVPFSPEVKRQLQVRYGENIHFINEAIEQLSGRRNLLD
jgi:hypothetical protein